MESVTVSPKYQIVIPAKIRKEIGLKPGQKMLLRNEDGVLRVSPTPTIDEMRGITKGIDIPGLRGKKDRFCKAFY